MNAPDKRRSLPSVERVLQTLGPACLPRVIVTHAVREEIARCRASKHSFDLETVVANVRRTLKQLEYTRLQPVINGTGILIHTNFGRAPLAGIAVQAISEAGVSYSNLEYDIISGERGGRGEYIEKCLAQICQSEGATVVNNCAAALVLALRYFTKTRREVIISRGELVQIGGGFRIPEILESSGAILREIGTTNKTSLRDYETAIGEGTGLILQVHRSNFAMTGFVESPSLSDVAAVAQKYSLPLLHDLGSGAIFETSSLSGTPHEPTPAECIRAGADLICFSGDKLFGGPQAGILAGRVAFIRDLKSDPFFRALRCDKLILAGLQATAELWLQDEEAFVPVASMLSITVDELSRRAERLIGELKSANLTIKIGSGIGEMGGGTLPGVKIPSITLDILPKSGSLQSFAATLRSGSPPVAGYIAQGAFKLDLRTIFPGQEEALMAALRAAQ